MTDPQVFANALSRLATAGTRGPGQIAGSLPNGVARVVAEAGHEAHRAREEHEAHRRAMQNMAGMNAVVQAQNAQRKQKRRVLPPNFELIPADMEDQALRELVLPGCSSAVTFAQSLTKKSRAPSQPEKVRRQAEAQLKLLQLTGDASAAPEVRGKAALALAQIASRVEGDRLPCPAVFFHMSGLAYQLISQIDPKAAEANSAALHKDLPKSFTDAVAQYGLRSICPFMPGLYNFTQTNNNIQPMSYLFLLKPNGTLEGRSEGVNHVMGRGPVGELTALGQAQQIANQISQSAVIQGRWTYALQRDQGGSVTARELRLDLFSTLSMPFMGTMNQETALDLEIVARGSGLLAYAEDGSQWVIREMPNPSRK